MKQLAALILLVTPALAEAPVVTDARTTAESNGFRFDVTLSHPDTGWDHYADAWRVETVDGTVLGTRELAHPHVDEQPFTRSLSGVVVPEGITQVVLRARCNVDGWSEEVFTLTLQ
ncbi:hypothetical protein [Aphanothece microscopica]|uniref:hypothetical protein n=1 Tax=Aphanothece microscopica TaxID=1049561 RepID=UPI003984D871